MVEQLAFIDAQLNKHTSRKVEKLLSSYGNMEAIIESMEKDVPEQKVTVSYAPCESQRSNKPNSQIENITMIKDKIAEKKIIKAKLDRIYRSLKKSQKEIWDKRYVLGYFDDDVINDIGISRRQYYREKENLKRTVAEAFYLL
jgi:ArpU family phage transcriptional regulator